MSCSWLDSLIHPLTRWSPGSNLEPRPDEAKVPHALSARSADQSEGASRQHLP